MDEQGPTRTNPCRLEGFRGVWQWQLERPGGKKAKVFPLSDKGVQIFEMAQFNVFAHDVSKGGGGISGCFAKIRRA